MLYSADGIITLPGAVYYNQAAGVQTEASFLAEGYSVPLENDFVSSEAAKVFRANAAFLFCVTDGSVIFAKNCYEQLYPASTTKLLTALTALKYGNLTDIVTVREDNGGITTYGAKLCGLKEGDQFTLEALLNSLLVYSGNDAAVAIAEHISGDVASFVSLMNEEAAAIGATHTHFVNPHGLHDINHTTTAYDMYLILNECLTYDSFLPMINQASYTAHYLSKDGSAAERTYESTNQYLTAVSAVPEGVSVYGGKTGSTGAAGDCLILYSSSQGKYYISAVFGTASRDVLYSEMTELLQMELSDNSKE